MKKYGIIGCGMMGHEHIANINLLDGAQVYSVYDPVNELAQAAAGKAGGAIVHPSIEAMVTDADLDAVVIASPNFRHIENLKEIARSRSLRRSIRIHQRSNFWMNFQRLIVPPFGWRWNIVICRPWLNSLKIARK